MLAVLDAPRWRTGVAAAASLLFVLVTAMVALVAMAAPASAHGRGSDATNFSSRVTDAPAIDGVRWEIYGGDELLEVENRTAAELLVPGYEGEPYLRVGPDGVYENQRSPATYLNNERYGQVPVPEEADPEAEPEWVRISSSPSHAWHDHRIHWMSPSPPPSVEGTEGPTLVEELSPWEVPFVYEGQEFAVVGELRWVPGPSPWPWLALGLVVTLPALAGVRTRPLDPERPGSPPSRWPGLARPAAVVLGIVALANVSNLVDDLVAVPMPWSTIALSALQTGLFVAVGLFGAVRGWQAGEGAFTALGVGAGALFVGQGLLYLSVLGASQLATVFPDVVPRTVVAASLMQALPIGAVAVLGTRRLLPAGGEPDDEEIAAVRS